MVLLVPRPHFFWVACKLAPTKVGAGHQNCPFFRIDLFSAQILNFLYIYALFSYLPFYTAELLKGADRVELHAKSLWQCCTSYSERAVLLSGQFWCPAPTLVGASLRATQKKWGRGTSMLFGVTINKISCYPKQEVFIW
jgi:hypothetical protein